MSIIREPRTLLVLTSLALTRTSGSVPLEDVSKVLGHESIKTTERYYARCEKGRQDRLDSLVTAVWARKKEGNQKDR
jgi:integrase